jgi:uridylate kinase
VYDKDPLKHTDAVKFENVTFQKVLEKGLGVMDATAIAMCRDNRMPIVVFNLAIPGNIMRMAMGETIGTLVHA